MDTMRFSEFRQGLAAAIDQVTADCDQIVVTRTGKKPSAVLISLAEYESLTETQHLLASEANLQHLLEALRDLSDQVPGDGT